MIAPSTDLDAFVQTARALAEAHDHYYIQRPSIVDKIEHNGRTFYTKFARIDAPLEAKQITEHLAHRVTLALPLEAQGMGSHIVFLYEGDAPERFVHMFEHLMQTEEITHYQIFPGTRDTIRFLLLPRPHQSITDLHAEAQALSARLETQMTKSWKLLPDPSLPESYNIITLPYLP